MTVSLQYDVDPEVARQVLAKVREDNKTTYDGILSTFVESGQEFARLNVKELGKENMTPGRLAGDLNRRAAVNGQNVTAKSFGDKETVLLAVTEAPPEAPKPRSRRSRNAEAPASE